MSHTHAAASTALPLLIMMWFGMMTAMMAPTVWPWVRAFERFQQETASTIEFVLGYFAAWLVYSTGVAIVQVQIGQPGHVLRTAIFVAAAAYQFSPLKQACLSHCRSPFSFFLARWHDGPPRALRIGISHGLYCLGCCWALMATSLAVGMANVWWMIVVAAVTFVEQVSRHGNRWRVPLGVALLIATAYPNM
jgi:predicted metal-binding membrane protein